MDEMDGMDDVDGESHCVIPSMAAQPTRRAFLKAAACGGTLAALGACAAQAETARPDILFIMPDQMRGDCLSALRHPVVRTPELDRLAAGGVLFRRAYSPVASCIPARYALLTGQHPQTSGVVGFKAKPITVPTLPGALAAAGYATVLAGRYMHQVPESGDCGYQRQILGSTHVDDDAYDRFLKKAAPETGGIRALVEKTGLTYNHWQAKPWPLADGLHPTEWIVARAREVVGDAPLEQPLFLTASFYAPHPPLFPPARYFEHYRKQALPPVAHGDWVDWKALTPQGDKSGHRVLLEGDRLRDAQAGYFGLIEHLDAQLAALISDFKVRSERAGRPWVIVVTSDHGEMLGDHGYFRKCEPFEGSANIPFIVAASPELGLNPGLRFQPVCLEDIMPTLLSLAGVASPAHVDGADLVPVLRDPERPVREWLHYEHAPCYDEAQAYHALTDGRFKYIWRPADGREHLFDLEADPREERDLSDEAAHRATLETWRARLVKRLAGRPEGFSVDGSLIPGRPYEALNEGMPVL